MVYIPPVAAAIEVADIGLADDGDLGWLVFVVGAGWGSGGNGQESGEDELRKGKFEKLVSKKKTRSLRFCGLMRTKCSWNKNSSKFYESRFQSGNRVIQQGFQGK